ncbi:MAG: alpha/beta hydrolase-fold protein, partial [bacterium]
MWNDAKHVWVVHLKSEHQEEPNTVEVLLPDRFDMSRKYRVLYVLPVETGIGGRYGDGLQEVRRVDAHNQYDLIGVQMAFDTVPWYADHPTDQRIQHESYLKNVIVPFIESRYPTLGTPEGRLLIGFSKSGWGAFTLILRNPNFFGYAVSWDAPLMLNEWVPAWGMDRAFGTQECFARHRPSALFEIQAAFFRNKKRLILLGEKAFGPAPKNLFRQKHQTPLAHEKMSQMGILHYRGIRFTPVDTRCSIRPWKTIPGRCLSSRSVSRQMRHAG